jgi:hypothetical protein
MTIRVLQRQSRGLGVTSSFIIGNACISPWGIVPPMRCISMSELISQGSLSSYPRKSKFSIASEGQLFHLKFIQKLS